MSILTRTFFIICLLNIFLISISSARIINVPDDEETIQAAIEEAEDDDVVLVEPGEYLENISLLGRNIIVTSHIHHDGDNAFIEQTIINGDEQGPVVTFDEEDESTLRGFTIRNGHNRWGGGIRCHDSSPIMEDLLITGNLAEDMGGGVYCSSGGSPVFQNVRVINNRAFHEGMWGIGG